MQLKDYYTHSLFIQKMFLFLPNVNLQLNFLTTKVWAWHGENGPRGPLAQDASRPGAEPATPSSISGRCPAQPSSPGTLTTSSATAAPASVSRGGRCNTRKLMANVFVNIDDLRLETIQQIGELVRKVYRIIPTLFLRYVNHPTTRCVCEWVDFNL